MPAIYFPRTKRRHDMKRFIAIAAIAVFATAAAYSDIARPDKPTSHTPKPPPGISTSMQIRLDADAKEARLIIPKSQIKQLRAELEQMDDDTNNTAAATGGFTRTQTMVSGAFLSLAFVFGGIWFMRSGRVTSRSGRSFVVIATVSGLVSAATLVYANAGPPPEARTINGKMFSQSVHLYKFGSGRIHLETGNQAEVTLIVPDDRNANHEE